MQAALSLCLDGVRDPAIAAIPWCRSAATVSSLPSVCLRISVSCLHLGEIFMGGELSGPTHAAPVPCSLAPDEKLAVFRLLFLCLWCFSLAAPRFSLCLWAWVGWFCSFVLFFSFSVYTPLLSLSLLDSDLAPARPRASSPGSPVLLGQPALLFLALSSCVLGYLTLAQLVGALLFLLFLF